jgi:hypothetical protein
MGRFYKYVGPSEILASVLNAPAGELIESPAGLKNWLAANRDDMGPTGVIVATYVIDHQGRLLLAPRRTEHVACASGGPVKSAGEISFTPEGRIAEVSNQSTGFCPEPESWPAVATALESVVPHPPRAFTREFVFRRCPSCAQILIIKENWFVCDVCDVAVPTYWNFED